MYIWHNEILQEIFLQLKKHWFKDSFPKCIKKDERDLFCDISLTLVYAARSTIVLNGNKINFDIYFV